MTCMVRYFIEKYYYLTNLRYYIILYDDLLIFLPFREWYIFHFLAILVNCGSASFDSTTLRWLFLESPSKVQPKSFLINIVGLDITYNNSLQTWLKTQICEIDVRTPRNKTLVGEPQDLFRSLWNLYTLLLIYRDNFPLLLLVKIQKKVFSMHPNIQGA